MRRATLAEMAEIAKKRSGFCLSTEYINAHTKLKWKCKKGHKWLATPNHIKSGTWCKICSHKNIADSQRLSITFAQKLALKNNGKCLSKEYINARTKLIWQCENGHQWQTTYDSVRRGSWCKICKGLEQNTLKDCFELANKYDGICVSKLYKNAHSKLNWRCKKGHEWLASYHNVRRGQWCPECGDFRTAEKLRTPIKDIRFLAKQRGGELVSKNHNKAKNKLVWQCSQKHRWQATYDSVRRGSWCPKCSSGYGERATKVIFQHIFKVPFEKIKPKWLKNVDGNLMEIDGYNSKLKIGFEHQGQQHYKRIKHFQSEADFQKRKRDDKKKQALCKQNNVTLLLIPEIPNLLPLDEAFEYIIKLLKAKHINVPSHDPNIDLIKIYAGKESLFELVKDICQKNEGELLTKNYLGRSRKHTFECKKMHKWDTFLLNVNNGSWCKVCEKEEKLNEIIIIAKNKQGVCLSKEYINAHSKLEFRCSHGHHWNTIPSRIMNGSWCPKCSAKKSAIKRWKDGDYQNRNK